MKNKIISSALILLVSIVISGCDSDKISAVQSTEYQNMYFEGNLGGIFNKTKFCTSVDWAVISNKKGDEFIEANCHVDLEFAKERKAKKADFIVYFEAAEDVTYFTKAMLVRTYKDGSTKNKEFTDEDKIELLMYQYLIKNIS